MLAALLITLSCLSLHTLGSHGQGVTTQYLSLAPDTFDDAYVGCSEEMEEKAVLLLRKEMANNIQLQKSWKAAQKAWEQKRTGLTLPPGFRSQHGIAILAYTSNKTLYQELNKAVRTYGGSWESYMNHFPFKALHFYLTRALQLLWGGGGCSREPGQVVFRGVRKIHFVPKSIRACICLGQFTSSSLDKNVAQGFGSATFFSLRTCFGVPIENLSFIPNEREVLIPSYEVFVVTNFSKVGNKHLVTLNSSDQMCSHFNCAYLGGKKRPNCESVPIGGQALALSKGAFSLLPWRSLLLASWGFQLLGAGL